MTQIPDEQAGPVPQREEPGISEKHRARVYELCNMRLRNELTDDEWDAEIRKLEVAK
jgi:hypothetical protein